MRHAVLFVLALAAPASRAQVFLEPCTPGLLHARDTVAADFDEDGLADAAILRQQFDSPVLSEIVVYAGHPDGPLLPHGAVPLAVPVPTGFLEAADLNGDGHVDLSVVCQTFSIGPEFSAVLGDGGGQLAIADEQGLPPFVTGEAVGDLNGDGVLDVLAIGWDGPAAQILYGQGDGTFLAPEPLLLAAQRCSDVGLGDLDGDGAPDVVVAHQAGQLLSWRINWGGGRFAPPSSVVLGAPPTGVVLAHLDGDGALDVAAAQRQADLVTVLVGDGAGGLLPAATFATHPSPADALAADLDGDGTLELVVVHGEDKAFWITPPWACSVHRHEPAGWSAPEGVSNGACMGADVADFNGDGTLDAVSAKREWLTFSPGDGLGLPATPLVEPGQVTHAVLAADVDGDGLLDALTVSATANEFALRAGDGTGAFGEPAAVSFPQATAPFALAAADLTGDGALDVVTANRLDASVSVLHGQPGGLAPPVFFGTGAEPRDLVVADLDGDGKPDVVTADRSSSTVSVLFGADQGRLEPPLATGVGANPQHLAADDVNADGTLDLAVTCAGDDTVHLLLADGSGAWIGGVAAAPGPELRTAELADMNSDGLPDLLFVQDTFVIGWEGQLVVQPGDGLGAFGTPSSSSVDGVGYHLLVDDFDGDGAPDVLLGHGGDATEQLEIGRIMLALGDGSGQLGPASTFFRGLHFVGLAAGDLNDDGAPDALALTREPDGLRSLLNRTGPAGP